MPRRAATNNFSAAIALVAALSCKNGNIMRTKEIYILAAAMAFNAAAFAQSMSMPAAKPQASVADEYTAAEIRKIDRPSGMITLKHGEIRNLGMSPMAMVFEAKDRKALDKFKVGDKVHFRAAYESGKYVLRDIELVK